MKLISSLALATVATVAVSSAAFAKDCGSRPAKVSVPDGATASEDTMKAFQSKTLIAYATAVNNYRKCLTEEVKASGDEYESVTSEWTRSTKAFQATPAKP
jgi:hypothetical protein